MCASLIAVSESLVFNSRTTDFHCHTGLDCLPSGGGQVVHIITGYSAVQCVNFANIFFVTLIIAACRLVKVVVQCR